MLSRAEAMAKANAYFGEEGMTEVAASATPNPLQGLWIVGYGDPLRPHETLVGSGPLVVPADGRAYLAAGSIPPWPEEIGLEEPEVWKYERGESLLPDSWAHRLADEFPKDYWYELLEFVGREREQHDVFPPPSQTFAAFEATPYDDVRVVILGQDPYPKPGEAHGLAFSVPVDIPRTPSLRNIHAELASDLGEPAPTHGNLEAWAKQGVLLLNTALTVRAGTKEDRSVHRRWRWQGQGWETFTNAVIDAVNAKSERVVFILWGADARRKAKRLDLSRHAVISSSHPSPLSAYRGFLGSRPFSQANDLLAQKGRGTIDWGRIRLEP
jgi:uracil-DNA glycosylase